MLEINIPEEFKALYGFRADGFNNIPKNERRSRLGDKLWKETLQQGVYEFMPVTLGGVELWNPVIRLVARKTVINTPMVERSGSVNEIISIDDWVINIRGVIKGTDGVWPDLQLSQLNELWKQNATVQITSAITSIFLNGNENVIITNLTLPESPGKVESELYEIECTSDIPFLLELE